MQIRHIFLTFAAVVLVACSSAPPSVVQSPATQVAAAPTYTPYPTYTPLPTYTPAPTYTPYPTYTPVAITATITNTSLPLPTTVLTDTNDPVVAAATMLTALNKVRAINNCGPLVLDPRLTKSASGHANDIAPSHLVSHVGTDGATLEDRLKRVGYPFERRSEIIGVGSLQGVIDAWMSEPPEGPHHASIVNCLYTDAGVGYALDPRGASFWVVDMGNRKQGS